MKPALPIHPRPAAEGVKRLLAACSLPSADLSPGKLRHFFACGPAEGPSGVVGLELFGTDALLRSLAVAQEARGKGCGRRLVQAAEGHARSRGATSLYLLTTSAEKFFRRLGYAEVPREAVPDAIRATPEFSALCPASAVAMSKRLDRQE